MARCKDCRPGPGRYEGEPVLTALCHTRLADYQSDEFEYGDGSWAAYSEIEPALATCLPSSDRTGILGSGYCAVCLDACLAQIAAGEIHTVTYGSDSQGFLWSVSWEDRDKAWEAFEADQAEMAWEGEEEE